MQLIQNETQKLKREGFYSERIFLDSEFQEVGWSYTSYFASETRGEHFEILCSALNSKSIGFCQRSMFVSDVLQICLNN